MITRAPAYFESIDGTSRVYIDDIESGYTASITLPLSYADRTDSNLGVFDAGPDYDYVRSSIRLFMTPERSIQLSKFFESFMRKGPVKLYIPDEWETYPFGAAVPTDTAHTVVVSDFKSLGQVEAPYLYHRYSISLVLEDLTSMAIPALVGCDDGGSISIGSVSGIRYPQRMFVADSTYEYYTDTALGGTTYQVSRSKQADKKYTTMELWMSTHKCGELMYKLIKDIRGGGVVLQVPKNSYPFGVESGDNAAYLCKISDPVITLTHNAYDNWTLKLSVIKIS